MMAAAGAAPALEDLTVSKVRFTRGVLGPTRDGSRVLRGDSLFVCFDVEGVTVAEDGKVLYSTAVELTDPRGRMVFKQDPRDLQAVCSLGGQRIPAFVRIHVGTDQPPGPYTLQATVTDRGSGRKATLKHTFEVLPQSFGIVQVSTTADSAGLLPMPAPGAGQGLWLHFGVVGFSRDQASRQPNVAIAVRVLDADGKPTLAQPAAGAIHKDVPEQHLIIPVQQMLLLNRPGRFTVELTATDQISGKTDTLTFPLTVGGGDSLVGQGEAAGTAHSARGTLLRRTHTAADWQVVDDKQSLTGGDLLLGLPGAELQSKNDAVRLTMLPDLESLLPVLEPAVVLHSHKDFDLDFTLDRGRVELTNTREKGSARVRVRAWGHTWEATLEAPGARLAVAVMARWRPGSRFTHNPGPRDVPSAEVVFLAVSGEVDLKHDVYHHLLKAPPGPAVIHWNNFVGQDPVPQHLDQLPAWAGPPQDEAGKERLKKLQEAVAPLTRDLASRPVGAVLGEMAESEDPVSRRVAIILLGATDDLRGLGKALHQEKHRDVWDDAVVVLRHWMGRAPDQDQALYHRVQEVWGYTPMQAETLVDFLHGFSESDLQRPETYQMLISFLGHRRLAVRGLAHWYLVRLVPAGQKIAYDPLAGKEARDRARQEWKKLVPPGKMPPRDNDKP
jgi:hypothetical protein